MNDFDLRNRHQKHSIILHRFLSEDWRIDGLLTLFLFARDYCGGRQTVKDIGAFAAHQVGRDNGPVRNAARDSFLIAKFHADLFGDDERQDMNRLPSITPSYLPVILQRLRPKEVLRKCGITIYDVRKELPEAINNLYKNDDATLSTRNLSTRQRNIVGGLCSIFVLRPYFSGDMLYKEFVETLCISKVLRRQEAKRMQSRKALIQLFSIALMHNAQVEFDQIRLNVVAIPFGNLSCGIEIPPNNPMRPTITHSMFETKLSADEHCSPDLLSIGDWKAVEIEIGRDMRLCRLALSDTSN